MRENGVQVLSPRGDFVAYPHATDDPAQIGPVDYVFLGLKAHSYPSCGPLVEPLLGKHTAVLPAQNGIPWWYFHQLAGPYQGRRIEAVDTRLLLVSAAERHPVAVRLEHRVEVVDRAAVVFQLRPPDLADDGRRIPGVVEVHLVLGRARWGLEHPGVRLGAAAAVVGHAPVLQVTLAGWLRW